MTISLQMRLLTCEWCFCSFLVPGHLATYRFEEEQDIFCPACGKGNQYEKDGPAQVPLEERQKHIQALHDAEQQEARAAEELASAQLVESAVERYEVLEGVENVKIVGNRMRCPHCKKSFVSGWPFSKHLQTAHQDEATAKKVKGRVIRSRKAV